MGNSITSAADESLSQVQSAERNATSTQTLKLVILWLAVGLPLLWGAVKALEDIGNLPM